MLKHCFECCDVHEQMGRSFEWHFALDWNVIMELFHRSLFFPFQPQVYVWVLNDEEDFKRAFDLGATGIMTDYPTKLKEFMEKNNYTATLK